jgi:hypothetical protein
MDGNGQAIQKIRAHHAALLGGLRERSEGMLRAAAGGGAADGPRADMLGYLREEILPHAEAEEATIYRRGHNLPELALLLDGMIAEHAGLRKLTGDFEAAPSARAAAIGLAITELFALHADKENDLLLPRLAQEPGVSVHDLLGDMHDLLEG